MQIIINRIALIIYNQNRIRRLKWAISLLIGAINISVFIIWMPARLQVSPGWVHVNDIWDRVEKGIFALADLGLNLYFVYLVRKELVRYGLTKYTLLYRYNIGMIFISMSLDVSTSGHALSVFRCLQFVGCVHVVLANAAAGDSYRYHVIARPIQLHVRVAPLDSHPAPRSCSFFFFFGVFLVCA